LRWARRRPLRRDEQLAARAGATAYRLHLLKLIVDDCGSPGRGNRPDGLGSLPPRPESFLGVQGLDPHSRARFRVRTPVAFITDGLRKHMLEEDVETLFNLL
jgi:hypothetical protein